MEISIEDVRKTLKKQRSRVEQRGYQPELVLGCFESLEVNHTGFCEGCKSYENVCKSYLLAHRNN